MADYGLPPEFELQHEDLLRNQRISDILLQRAMGGFQEPTQHGRIASRSSPLAPLVQGAMAFAAKKKGDEASAGRMKLGQEYEGFMRREADQYLRQRQGYQPQADPQELEQNADQGTPLPQGQPQARRDLAMNALLSRNPAVQALGRMDYEAENKLDQPHNVAPGGSLVTGRGQVLNQQPPLHQIPNDWQKALPPNATRLPNDPAGVFRMKGASGVDDVYAVEFEGGSAKGYKRLDQDTGGGRNGANAQPYYTPIAGSGGVLYAFDHRTSNMVPKTDAKGNPIIAGKMDPTVTGNNAAAAAAGKERGDVTEQARLKLKGVEDATNQGLGLIDRLVGSEDGKIKPHKGFESYVGLTMRPGARLFDGTPEADMDAILKQSLGGAFLKAYDSLRGTGQVTQIEGQKATDAITRMSKSTSEAEFKLAAADFRAALRRNLAQQQKLAGTPAVPNANVPPPPNGFVVQ